ncbi:phosphatase PAP2 family protein [Thermodesulfobacterium hveragerdense]|uniref:phosphatase PAP2 family protein n=1 Tax=Thermodesulfobacterium hveragerdense TaxID=53424 RepID=UPI0003FB959E|nr:phosphatase PAP2 family protein [Thermodesulfobacterium hveragerdense]
MFLCELDLKLFYVINHFRHRLLDLTLPYFSHPDLIYVFFVTSGWLILKKKTLLQSLIIWIFLILGYVWVDFSCAKILKPYFQRPRPFVSQENLYYYSDQKHRYLNQPLKKDTSYSFPSNHASNVAFTSVYLSLFYPPFAWGWTLFMLLVGWSRIYLGHHYPFDVLFGFFWGGFWGWTFYLLVKTLLKKLRYEEKFSA